MKYEQHPLGAIFPKMTDAEFAGLRDSIAADGLRFPIWIWESKILDGWHRYMACGETGRKPKYEHFAGNANAARKFIIDANLKRRHLNESQRSMIAGRLANTKLGDNQHAGGSVNLPTQVSTSEAATVLNVSPKSVTDARAVLGSKDAELIERVDRGDEAVSSAAKKARAAKPKKEKKEKKERTRRVLPESEKFAAAREEVRPLVEANKPVPTEKIAEKLGVAHETVIRANYQERGVQEGLQKAAEQAQRDADSAPIDTSGLSPSAQERFAALERRLRAQLEAQFNERLRVGIRQHVEDILMPAYKEKLERADRIINRVTDNVLPFTNKEYRQLMAALHPDCQDQVLRMRVFNWVTEREAVLRKPDPNEKKLSDGLPTSLEELMKRRR